ncbi:50S ribosomal protein L17 [Candidatus Woesebacteria bacterium RIFCSPHIGHO2_01_FULL_39_17]|uniref:50S ribosomal protein L17 n=4 Tax=Microgenomates group TaxID=1794810 RepID=A0A0H4TDJ6_9BACT|nr:50S ribosomal protein L17, large subunit ribosomal protein L17 [uncultured Microgenomates bacterium Rifle_16ft_4_minimus_954]KKQ51933.1 MAG: 50S ribosomal protein L17 [Microgenomates group bacterium GW2011_GWC1_38_12]KKQ94403.1 MAG: 50S ribosomal protein L17 [Candidatus Woesebacteria bacterium GW2011_GWB1_39_10b]KKR14415.1 MAG: 50S ribosomal protein L17 [Candidatus Woesebacteria bacterium GW2011_GWA1_39_21b]OGM23788.1 MAG: 50S ribosomal protein L17 [Candidatus Woesebacteria bacterium RIFCSPH
MKKKVFGRKLSRDRGSREALFRSLIKALILHGSINTTKAKAKAIQSDVDKLVTLAKKGDMSARRRVYAILANDKASIKKLFGEISEAFINKIGGFTRIINLPRRRGDLAEVARLEWSRKIVISDKQKVTSKKGKIDEKRSLKENVQSREKSKIKREKTVI